MLSLCNPLPLCWICGSAVSPDGSAVDELGYMVHPQCLATRLALIRAWHELGTKSPERAA
jgi:hypothetical protein